jgi:hypothetical protein
MDWHYVLGYDGLAGLRDPATGRAVPVFDDHRCYP